jgi:cyanophycinase-like exopeptidase
MLPDRGVIALMGSGELTSTMVEVHKALVGRYGGSARAVFIDTPAGFQLNADQISQKAAAYFQTRVQQTLQIASFKSAEDAPETAFDDMRKADLLLVGPGSPTYALGQWQQSPVPDIMLQRVRAGSCLVAASAAALTVGRLTLPVYEIYKVGLPVHWVNGLDLLGRLGMDLAVIPHWNNAEGGNHDTRYCFMGEKRMDRLIEALPDTTRILGLDEHTALIIDFSMSHATVQGIGGVTLKDSRREMVFAKGDGIPLSLLAGESFSEEPVKADRARKAAPSAAPCERDEDPFAAIHASAARFRQAIDAGHDEKLAGDLMEMERLIWGSRELLEEQNAMGAAREILRDALAVMTTELASRPKNLRSCLSTVMEAVLRLRDQFRDEKKWNEADALRDCLKKEGIQITDSPEGPTWNFKP